MEIQSFEPYHIGIKLNPSLPIDALRQKILPKLRSSGFNEVSEDKIPSNVSHEIEVIAKDGNNKIELNYPLSALNTVGTEPTGTTETFKKLLGIIESLGYEIKGVAASIDIVTNVFVKTDDDPTELINGSVKCDLNPWQELNKNTNVNGLKIDLIDEEYGKETLRIIVGPSSLSPTSQIVLTFRYVNIEPEPIIDFGLKLEERTKKFVNSLGSKN